MYCVTKSMQELSKLNLFLTVRIFLLVYKYFLTNIYETWFLFASDVTAISRSHIQGLSGTRKFMLYLSMFHGIFEFKNPKRSLQQKKFFFCCFYSRRCCKYTQYITPSCYIIGSLTVLHSKTALIYKQFKA